MAEMNCRIDVAIVGIDEVEAAVRKSVAAFADEVWTFALAGLVTGLFAGLVVGIALGWGR